MTTAAILAAGTMLAGAAVEGWTDATYTLVGNNSGGISSGNGVTAGRGAFATITVDEESLSTLSAADYSWQITFSVTAPNNSSFGMVYSSMGGGNGSGVALAVKYDGSQYTYELRSGSNGVGSKPALTSGSGTTSITTTSTDVTLTWDTDENTFTLGVGEEEGKDAGGQAGQKLHLHHEHEPGGAQRIAHQLAGQHRPQPGQQPGPAAATESVMSVTELAPPFVQNTEPFLVSVPTFCAPISPLVYVPSVNQSSVRPV